MGINEHIEDSNEHVYNRDIPLLSDYLSYVNAIELANERILEIRGQMFNITQHISDMPSGGGLPSGIDGAMARLSDAERRYREKL